MFVRLFTRPTIFIAAAFLLLGCDSFTFEGHGGEGMPCISGDKCNSGLTCVDNLCVSQGGDTDIEGEDAEGEGGIAGEWYDFGEPLTVSSVWGYAGDMYDMENTPIVGLRIIPIHSTLGVELPAEPVYTDENGEFQIIYEAPESMETLSVKFRFSDWEEGDEEYPDSWKIYHNIDLAEHNLELRVPSKMIVGFYKTNIKNAYGDSFKEDQPAFMDSLRWYYNDTDSEKVSCLYVLTDEMDDRDDVLYQNRIRYTEGTSKTLVTLDKQPYTSTDAWVGVVNLEPRTYTLTAYKDEDDTPIASTTFTVFEPGFSIHSNARSFGITSEEYSENPGCDIEE